MRVRRLPNRTKTRLPNKTKHRLPNRTKTRRSNRTKTRRSNRTKSRRTTKVYTGIIQPLAVKTATQFIGGNSDAFDTVALNELAINCGKTNSCISFYPQSKSVVQMFRSFDLDVLRHISGISIRTTKLSEGSNGIVYEISFTPQGSAYTAKAVIKKCSALLADSMPYEYMVGLFINRYAIPRFPNFAQTYAIYGQNALTGGLALIPEQNRNNTRFLIEETCNNNDKLAIMIEHFSNFSLLSNDVNRIGGNLNNLYQMRKKTMANPIPIPLNADLLKEVYTMYTHYFQVYFALSGLSNTFTHYDLHDKNIGLYRPFANRTTGQKYIRFHYHYDPAAENKVLTFVSDAVVKLIDYGRCYFKDIENGRNSSDIQNAVQQTAACQSDVGSGFDTLSGIPQYYVTPAKPNNAHDLLSINHFVSILRSLIRDSAHAPNIRYARFKSNLLGTYQWGTPNYDPEIARPQMLGPEQGPLDQPVCTVTDMYRWLRDYLIANNPMPSYGDHQIAAELHIYADPNKEYTLELM